MNPSYSLPDIDFEIFDGLIGVQIWWWVYGLFALVGLVFGLVVLYHWLRYETNVIWSGIVIVTNAAITVALLGGAAVNLSNWLS